MKNRLQKILEREHQGKDNAIVSRALEERLGCKGTMIREMVNELRSAGVTICSDRNGYYIAKCREELDRTIVQLKSRVKKIQSAIDGLEAVRMRKEGNYDDDKQRVQKIGCSGVERIRCRGQEGGCRKPRGISAAR